VINEALGAAAPSHNLNHDNGVDVADVQIVMNAVIGRGCAVSGN
jgi:hypothetical protein